LTIQRKYEALKSYWGFDCDDRCKFSHRHDQKQKPFQVIISYTKRNANNTLYNLSFLKIFLMKKMINLRANYVGVYKNRPIIESVMKGCSKE